ncbi:MAG: adenylate/guanylate cyclase domain-containing protein [Acuticoccus sp.]
MDGRLLATLGEIEEYLALAALRSPPVEETIEGVATRARAGGLSVARFMMGWRLLDPLYRGQTTTWSTWAGAATERHGYGNDHSPGFLASPVWYLLHNEEEELRRRIDGANAPFDFPLLDELKGDGCTDYLIVLVGFGTTDVTELPGGGLIISFASDRPGGFTDDEVAALHRLKYMIAVTMRSAMELTMRATLANTYLGRTAGQKVLAGQISRGEGETVDAVIWYCDLRGSTALCEAMGVADYLPLLNDYFSAMAEPVVAQGGQVLDFIGDAVLAIFPLEEGAIEQAQRATAEAIHNLADLRARHAILADRRSVSDITGIAIATGRVAYGNIGIATRLTFSVIGPTVNRVARIERLTKLLHEPVLVTAEVAAATPSLWVSRGRHHLEGVAENTEIFSPLYERWPGSMCALAQPA